MKIRTKFHGEIEITKEQIIQFDKGIPGLEEQKQFIILELTEEKSIKVMQSITTTSIAFFITNPFDLLPTYEFKLDEASKEELEINETKDIQLEVFVIMAPKKPFDQTTINLQAPLVINHLNNKAKQIILNDDTYEIKHPLFQQAVTSIKEGGKC